MLTFLSDLLGNAKNSTFCKLLCNLNLLGSAVSKNEYHRHFANPVVDETRLKRLLVYDRDMYSNETLQGFIEL